MEDALLERKETEFAELAVLKNVCICCTVRYARGRQLRGS